ncbi:hypothetical protein [Amycolatopsis albispora]|uniref:Uncharacterized protein n=1 Tax=Amycolatopsis albispora TaxID=1804986 RepID=A0A344LGZ9_9PSEU|nr:hypothetical protein [Amycolatopsis albispora]AXB47323.1 hypothetical protein A4R43_36760 [Amycolatopsis albispora]
MSARLKFGEIEPLLPTSGELPTVGELPVPRWEEPESAAAALRWWWSCGRCRRRARSIFDVLMHQRQCRGECGPDWPTEDEDGAR